MRNVKMLRGICGYFERMELFCTVKVLEIVRILCLYFIFVFVCICILPCLLMLFTKVLTMGLVCEGGGDCG